MLEWIAEALLRPELTEDPTDALANWLLHQAQGTNLSEASLHIAAAYLIRHGLVKLILVAALVKRKFWAYPWMMGLLVAFIAYQVYRIAVGHSVTLILLTALDIILLGLTWREWEQHKRRTAAGGAPLP